MKLRDIKKISTAIKKKWPQFSWKVLLLFLFLILIIIIVLSSSFSRERINISTPNDSSLELKNYNNKVEEDKCKNCYINPLTGVEQKEEIGFPVAIVIDNHIDARPPVALSEAHIVYELPVEGSITRYLSIYDSTQDLNKIGPVRSARPYMLDYVQELSALFVHVGGSPQALVDIVKNNIFDLNEFYNGDYFIRNENRPKPHHIFIDFANIKDYIASQNKEKKTFFPWQFKDNEENININSTSNDLDTNINIDFGADAYEVNWVYDFENNNYLRSLNNKIHVDDKNIAIRAKNIIIQRVNSKVLDEKLRLKIDTISEGEAVICFEAKCKQGTWKKESAKARTRYYINGKEVKFSIGNFWIEILDQKARFEY